MPISDELLDAIARAIARTLEAEMRIVHAELKTALAENKGEVACDRLALRAMIADARDAMAAIKDGAPGPEGAIGPPGLGFEDITEELADDGRTIIRRYQRGDIVREFRHTFGVVLDRGVYRDNTTYQRGDGVTWAGSFWIAQDATAEKPDTGKGWRLAVKRGRDGKDTPK